MKTFQEFNSISIEIAESYYSEMDEGFSLRRGLSKLIRPKNNPQEGPINQGRTKIARKLIQSKIDSDIERNKKRRFSGRAANPNT